SPSCADSCTPSSTRRLANGPNLPARLPWPRRLNCHHCKFVSGSTRFLPAPPSCLAPRSAPPRWVEKAQCSSDFLGPRRRSQVVRQTSAKSLCLFPFPSSHVLSSSNDAPLQSLAL